MGSDIAPPLYRSVQYTTVTTETWPWFSTAELVEMHRRMLVIRGFEERVAALYRDGSCPDSSISPSGRRRRPSAHAGRSAPRCHHLHPPRTRALPGQGTRSARHVRRAHGTRRRDRTGAEVARCTSPTPALGIFGANGIVAAGLPIAVGAATAAQLTRQTARSRSHSSATERRPRARSTKPSIWPRSGACR